MKEKQVFVFDLDGTLVDTTHVGFRKININLSRLGLRTVSEEFLRQHWGKKAHELFLIVCKKVGATVTQYEDFCQHDKIMLDEYSHNEEINSALLKLKGANVPIGLITSRSTESLKLLTDKINFDLSMFDFKQTLNDHHFYKPHGKVFDPLIYWTKQNGFNDHNLTYFGDTVDYDLAATRAARKPIRFVGVVSGVNTKEEFLNAGVLNEDIIPSFEELPSYINSRF